MAVRYTYPNNPDYKFDGIFRGNYTQAIRSPFPKIAHFVHTDVKELTWFQWAAVRATIVNLGVERVCIWLPENIDLKGWIWNRVLEIAEVEVRRITMPITAFGGSIDTPERQSDLVRLKILYEEGGIYLDTDLVALKSIADVLYNPTTRATVMAMQYRGEALPNGFIMSKPGSPFLKKWIQHYGDVKIKKNWHELATTTPYSMYLDRDPDLTVLDRNSWFYPLSAEEDGDATLKALWFGKSWHTIGQSYGTHFWHPVQEFAHAIKPLTVRMVDTPLFCHTRKLFDNLDNDGYYAEPPETNPNCSISWTKGLKEGDHRIFSDYRIITDDLNMKMIDSSGFHHHGWASDGMSLETDGVSGQLVRTMSSNSFAVLPVPADWDTRLWSARMTFDLETKELTAGTGIGLFKIRMETGGEILVRIRNDNPFPGITVQVEWHGDRLAKEQYQTVDDNTWISKVGLPELKTGPHEIALVYDRKTQGNINLFLDGRFLANDTLSIIASPKIGQDIWINAQEWDHLDTGFQGTINRFTMYADALSPQDIAAPISSSLQSPSSLFNFKSTISDPHLASSPWILIPPFIILTMIVIFLLRKRGGRLASIRDKVIKLRRALGNAPDLASSTINSSK